MIDMLLVIVLIAILVLLIVGVFISALEMVRGYMGSKDLFLVILMFLVLALAVLIPVKFIGGFFGGAIS